MRSELSDADQEAVSAQLGRPVRNAMSVVARCACGEPLVIQTAPRLSDGQPFPTVFYLTCPAAISAIGTLESEGSMSQYESQLSLDPELRASYARAHRDYLTRRAAIAEVSEIADTSVGGMPNRVKCLHALAAHALAVGPGINPIGDDVVARITPWCHQESKCR
jgi:hypothetical protein